ncbi:immunoglobulin I-set domain protein [Streptomyces sp. NPDC050803]|uniref:immunoglobulin I-set domain protein n=1 Tax=unclassified Streptomyces TaxID=2593676 RepID=UPI00342EB084
MHLRRTAALAGAAALVAATAAVGSSAQAADTPKTALGKDGQQLTVSASANLDPDGETLQVTGSGYDDTKGIYVAVCKDNGDNRIPTPCLGGADQSGDSGASKWIIPRDASDEGAGTVAERWGEGGTFDVDLNVKAKDGGLDCLEVACSVVTRVDHNAAGDRSQDVRIPITFQGQDPGEGDGGGDGVDVPAGTVSYVRSAEFTTAGRPLDLLLHPDSGKLYVGSENIPDTADVNEAGLYALDPKDGTLLSKVAQAPGLPATSVPVGRRIIAPLAGDGVLFHYPLRGIGMAKDGDTAAQGYWYTGTGFTGVGQDADTSSVLVAAGPELRRIDLATGTVKSTVSLEGGKELGVDAVRNAAWSIGAAEGKKVLRRVDTTTFQVTATTELPTETGLAYFVETDPATGNVWVGADTSVLVFDKDGKQLTTLTGEDRPTAMAFDKTTGRAFVLRPDPAGNTGDGNGVLEVLDSATFQQAAAPVALTNSEAPTYSGVAVAPGATSVYVTNYTESKVAKFDLRMSPKVTQAPTDQTVAPGDEVAFVAAAEGTPEPTVSWSVSPDGGQTWSKIEGATENAYKFTAKAAQDGYRYRAEFTNPVGTTRTSPITLTVQEAPDDGGTEPPADGEDTEPSGSNTVTGPEGQQLTVTPVNNLAVENQTLKVTGSGYDTDKGIYVALCVDNGEGELPTPCIGGVDMSGESHSSAWISSNPPDYGEDLAIPYGKDGSFEVELTVDAKDEFTDCFKAKCVLATRADHTLSGDRSQDVKVPVSFVGQDPVDTDDGTGGAGGSGTGGTGTDGGTGTTGGTGAGSTTGGTGTTNTSTAGGSLASTGVTVGSVAALAAALTAAGWVAYRRGRTV